MNQSCEHPDFRYFAFISYSHHDTRCAQRLHKALERYAVPRRLVGQRTAAGVIPGRLTPIFRDSEELPSAHDLSGKVTEALAQSRNLIVICSPHAATSRWVDEEIRAYHRLGRSERIFCLIVEGEPDASDIRGREDEECFAPALRFRVDGDGQTMPQHTEPIAADVRPGKDDMGTARLRLVAGMLGIGFDQLKQREQQRRRRHLTAIAALALAVMAVTTTLAITAVIARHSAEIARRNAERRQKQAENLVGFMLGDLNDKLQQVSRLDIMEAVDDHAMAYFQSLPTQDVTDQALQERARALEKIGSVRQAQGHQTAAMASFEAAARLTAALARKAPGDTARQLQHARALAFIGQTHWAQGQLQAAQNSFETAQSVLLRAKPSRAHTLQLQFNLEMLANDIGHVLEARGRLGQAAALYRHALALSKALVTADPDNTAWAAELGGAHNNLGKLALLRGDLATAIAEYRQDDAIESALAARNPRDNNQRENMLRVRAILGRTLALAGDDRTGMQHLQTAVQTAIALMNIDPHNSDFKDDFARYATQLARLKRLSGATASARSLTTRALATLRKLVRQNPGDTLARREYAEALSEQAAEFLAARQRGAALRQAHASLAILDPLLAAQPHERSILLAAMTARLLLAESSTDADGALRLREAVIAAIRAQPGGRRDPRLLALQVEALLALDRQSEAQSAIHQLWHNGYRDAALLARLQHARIPYPPNQPFLDQLMVASRRAAQPTAPDTQEPRQ